jgi:hypothetical protein
MHMCMCLTAAGRQGVMLFTRMFAVILLVGLTQGCATAPSSLVIGRDPSDPYARVPPTRYRSVLSTYASGRLVEPGSWSKRNSSDAPTPEKDGQ